LRLNRSILLVLLVGIVSSIAIIYFYLIQREFTKNHREFLTSTSKLKHSQSRLDYLILENSVYAYQNQDKIKNRIKKLLNEYKNLKESTILKDKTYTQIDEKIIALKEKIDSNLENIEDYLMFNAGIKNSLLFLTRHVENSELSKIDDNNIVIKANYILKHFYDTKRIQDLDYLENESFLLISDSKDKKVQEFVRKFNIHSKFLAKGFKKYINSVNSVLDNNVYNSIVSITTDFSKIALKDFKALDIFAFILFSIFILSLSFIIFLLYSYIQKNQALKHSLTYDQLTNLYNRKSLEYKLTHISKPTLLLINIDGFKNINDIYGNEVGDSLLIKIAQMLKKELTNLNIFRLGGDEFGTIFEDITENEVLKIANKLEKTISKHNFIFDNLKLNISVSIVTNNIFPILENADLTLKLLKHNPNKRVMKYTDNLNLKKSVQENMQIVEMIKSAIADDRVIPYFQPIINLQTSKIEKYEALVRIRLEDGTILSPFKFLEISKKSSDYHEITKIMINKIIQTAKEFPEYRFSLNISMLDILNEQLITMLFDCFEKNRDTVSRVDIELLESEFLEDTKKVQEFIEKLHSYGSKILIDDFGSGYSNFSYFSNLEIDIVKIDGSIVSEIINDHTKLHILKTIHQFTNGMNKTNIAEYVENREIALILKEIGIKYAQGYYFSQPLPRPLNDSKVII